MIMINTQSVADKLIERARELIREGKDSVAIRRLKSALLLEESPRAHLLLAKIALSRGLVNQAKDAVRAALEIDNTNPECRRLKELMAAA